MDLTPKQYRFVMAYLGEARGDASKAAQIAGYQHYKQQGYQTKNQPAVRAAIDKALAERAVTPDEVFHALIDQARSTIRPFLRIERGPPGENEGGFLPGNVEFDLSTPEAEACMHLVQELTITKKSGETKDGGTWANTTIKVKLYSSQAAWTVLARWFGRLGPDKPEEKGEAEARPEREFSLARFMDEYEMLLNAAEERRRRALEP